MNNRSEIQGHFLGIPYDWRWPTVDKIVGRCWQPGGPALVPKVLGWGWTLNLANHRAQGFIFAALLLALTILVFGG